jgi:hypothetical protein
MSHELVSKWKAIMAYFHDQFGKKPDLNAILFIIGMREWGSLQEEHFSKEDKVMLFHIAVCKILSYSGYYSLEGRDLDGWPVWKLQQQIPHLDIFQQELFLKQHIITYFEEENIITFENEIN